MHTIKENFKGKAIRDLIFFVLFYVYLLFYIDPRLFYVGAGKVRYFPVFNKGWIFFIKLLENPGGLAEYISAFLAQFFYFSWTGALVVTLQAWVLSAFISYQMKSIKAARLQWIRYIPPIVLLIFYSQYSFYFPTITILALTFCFTWLYIAFSPRNSYLGLIVFFVLSIITYAAVGGTYILFAFLCAMYEFFKNRRWQLSLVFLVLMIVTPYIEGGLFYKIRVENAYFSLTPLYWIFQLYSKNDDVVFLYGLYLLLPLISVLLLIWQTLLRKHILTAFIERITSLSFIKNKFLRWIIRTCFLLIVTAVISYLSFDKTQKAFFAVQYHAHYQNWEQVLEAAKENPKHPLIIAAVNRALFHTGQLGESALTLMQNPGSLLLTGREYEKVFWYQQDIFLDLGYINGAEHDVVECLEYYGEQSYLLKKLAIINMVKGNIGTAKIYLKALRKRFFYTNWAEMYLNRIEANPSLSIDQQVQHLRSLMMDRNHIINYQLIDGLLLELVEKNPNNKMAFEYLMTCYILTKDIKNFAVHLEGFNRFYQKCIPRLFEEAVLIIANDSNANQYLQGKKLFISKQTIANFKEFIKVLNEFKKGKNPSLKDFPAEFKNTYFFYYTFFNYIHSGY